MSTPEFHIFKQTNTSRIYEYIGTCETKADLTLALADHNIEDPESVRVIFGNEIELDKKECLIVKT